jgi:hypothetical protein
MFFQVKAKALNHQVFQGRLLVDFTNIKNGNAFIHVALLPQRRYQPQAGINLD